MNTVISKVNASQENLINVKDVLGITSTQSFESPDGSCASPQEIFTKFVSNQKNLRQL